MCDDYGGWRGREGCANEHVPSKTGSGQRTVDVLNLMLEGALMAVYDLHKEKFPMLSK